MAALTISLHFQRARVTQTGQESNSLFLTHCLCLHIIFVSSLCLYVAPKQKKKDCSLCPSTVTLSSSALLQFSASPWVCSQMAAPENSHSSPAFHCFPFCLCECVYVCVYIYRTDCYSSSDPHEFPLVFYKHEVIIFSMQDTLKPKNEPSAFNFSVTKIIQLSLQIHATTYTHTHSSHPHYFLCVAKAEIKSTQGSKGKRKILGLSAGVSGRTERASW